MRIVRYELEIVDYQQIQPLWPGTILAVKPGRRVRQRAYSKSTGQEITGGPIGPIHIDDIRWESDQKIDMWCIDDSENPNVEAKHSPILGIWIVGTDHPMPRALVNPYFGQGPVNVYDGGPIAGGVTPQGTCVMANGLTSHVFSVLEGVAQPVETRFGEVSSIGDLAEKVADRRRAEMQQVADMARTARALAEPLRDPDA